MSSCWNINTKKIIKKKIKRIRNKPWKCQFKWDKSIQLLFLHTLLSSSLNLLWIFGFFFSSCFFLFCMRFKDFTKIVLGWSGEISDFLAETQYQKYIKYNIMTWHDMTWYDRIWHDMTWYIQCNETSPFSAFANNTNYFL